MLHPFKLVVLLASKLAISIGLNVFYQFGYAKFYIWSECKLVR